MKLEGILRKHARPATLYAAEPVKQGLLADLRKQVRFNNKVHAFLFTAVCILAAMAIGALFTDLLVTTTARTAILTGTGLGVPAAFELMRRVVREWSQLNLLITLVAHSDETAIQALIQKLLSSASVGFGAG